MIYSTGVCKPFPPPLVRGGVFLVGSETKYRDIADWNGIAAFKQRMAHIVSEPKYRDIADWNELISLFILEIVAGVRTQVPRYSGWETPLLSFPCFALCCLERNYRDYSHALTQLNSLNKAEYLCCHSMKLRPDFDYLEKLFTVLKNIQKWLFSGIVPCSMGATRGTAVRSEGGN